MKSFLLKPLLGSAISLIILCFVHYLLIEIVPLKINFSVLDYYAILTSLTLGVIVLSLIWFFKKPEQLNAGFLYGSVIKVVVVASYVFLVLELELKSDKIHVTLLYVLSLFIEIFFIGKTLNNEPRKK